MKNLILVAFAAFAFLCQESFGQTVDSSKNSLLLTHEYYHFKRHTAEHWHVTSLQYKRTFPKGALLGRLNHANRFSSAGWQAEVEAYPRLSKKVYLYAGLGYSPDAPVFPKFRSGASLYAGLPRGWEVEGGYRQLYFDQHIWIGTAGISKYAGFWLLNVRSFISKAVSGTNHSHFVTARRYFGKEGQYAWVQAGSGISPEDARNVQLREKSNLSSERASAGVNLFPGKRSMVNASFAYSRDEYINGKYGNQLSGSIAYGIRF